MKESNVFLIETDSAHRRTDHVVEPEVFCFEIAYGSKMVVITFYGWNEQLKKWFIKSKLSRFLVKSKLN